MLKHLMLDIKPAKYGYSAWAKVELFTSNANNERIGVTIHIPFSSEETAEEMLAFWEKECQKK